MSPFFFTRAVLATALIGESLTENPADPDGFG